MSTHKNQPDSDTMDVSVEILQPVVCEIDCARDRCSDFYGLTISVSTIGTRCLVPARGVASKAL